MAIQQLQAKATALLTPQSQTTLTATRSGGTQDQSHRRFSPFDPQDSAESAGLVNLFWSIADAGDDQDSSLERVLDTADAAVRSHGSQLVQHALMVFATHHNNGRRLKLPTFFERHPDITRALSQQPLTARSLGPEQALDWWREDPFFNEHHLHWHLVYPGNGVAGVLKDRHGEIFLYMHQQMLARYDTERLCADLPAVVPLDDFTAPIPEAYIPDSVGGNLTPRPANQIMLPHPQRPFLTPQLLTQWRDAIADAISTGRLINDAGAQIPLASSEDIDILGNTLESNAGSASQQYGSLHNLGHGLIASSPRPSGTNGGAMGSPTTSAMDPVFWRWHRMIDDLGATFQESLDPQTFDDIPAGVVIRNQDVMTVTADKIPDFETHDQDQLEAWAESTFGGANWDADFTGDAQISEQIQTYLSTATITLENENTDITLDYGNHDDFAYVLRVENTEAQDRTFTLRCWICLDSESNNRRAWIELDTFQQQILANTRKVIYRSARHSSVVRKHEGLAPRPPRLESRPGESDRDFTDDDYCECGWPYSLLLPRGTLEGAAFRLMVMVTENDVDMQGHSSNCGSIRLCGARNILYPDQRPMGYPFHRRWAPERTVTEWIDHNSNMASRPLTIQFRGIE